ncbi:STAS domain-containing protein [Rhodobacter maris]|uniref:STAS domain-containing protein n=1 Tax=Rhodobacter maris TaxID=446682 RepID=A0A285T1W4_9RHOB|nr:STAS domain-containing protein [Rhodobacter maris]SOC13065.1 STAS domain-containing protein [Rhodobacter maris]
MPNETPESSAINPIVLAEDVGLRDAPDLHASLLRTFESGGAVVVDATRAAALHVSVLQVLIAAQRQAAVLGRSFSLIASERGTCASAFARAGLALPGVAPGEPSCRGRTTP